MTRCSSFLIYLLNFTLDIFHFIKNILAGIIFFLWWLLHFHLFSAQLIFVSLITLIFQKLNNLADHDTVLGQELKLFRRPSDNMTDKKIYIMFYYGVLVHSCENTERLNVYEAFIFITKQKI